MHQGEDFKATLDGGTLGTIGSGTSTVGGTMTGVFADALYQKGTVTNANTIVGGRFSAAGNTNAARSFGVLATATGSSTNNIGILAVANDDINFANSSPKLNTAAVRLIGGGAAVLAVNPINTGNNRAIYSDGQVQLANLGATTATNLVGIDASGNLSTTTLPSPILSATMMITFPYHW